MRKKFLVIVKETNFIKMPNHCNNNIEFIELIYILSINNLNKIKSFK